jgi:hypothetical protein
MEEDGSGLGGSLLYGDLKDIFSKIFSSLHPFKQKKEGQSFILFPSVSFS